MKLKKGDKVLVIAGKSKGQSGAIVRVLTSANMVLLDGINLVKRHRKPSAQNRKGQIVDKPMPIHASNVMLVDPKTDKPTRVGRKLLDDGRKVRYAKGSGEVIDR